MPAKNRLAHEKSPYLLQHAANPVDWFPWGQEAFDEAARRQKPIFLSIGYSTCHWCHVMAHESFEDSNIALLINEHFVPVKVDREERPDVDHIYMTAVTAMTGQGGWPLSVFLTPDGKPFYGGTYFPPYAKWGTPGFSDLLLSIAQAWETGRSDIVTSSAEITSLLQGRSQIAGQADIMPPSEQERLLNAAYHQIASQFDSAHGGFGQAPKFPMGHSLSFLLRHFERTRDAYALHMVEQSLTAMSRGGIYDHLGGGFHRYSTDRQWRVPHFEKMLYDQALLVMALVECYQATGAVSYARTAAEVVDYALRDLRGDGAFYCAEDADSVPSGQGGHAREGAFYVWAASEINDVLGKDAAQFNAHFGVMDGGNAIADPHGEFTGLNILHLSREAGPEGEDAALKESKARLFTRRADRPRPHLDDKVLTDWNGLMIAACAMAGVTLGRPLFVDAARQAADFILTHLATGDQVLHRWRDGWASIDGMLDDYAFFAYGLCHLYEATFEQSYLDAAVRLTEAMIVRFADTAHGGFFMTAENTPGLIMRPQDVYDGALPSGNSVALHVLLKLHHLTGRAAFLEQAASLIRRFLPVVAEAPQAYTMLLSGLDLFMRGAVDIKLAGGADEANIANLRKVVYKHFIPRKAFRREAGEGPWSATVCKDGTCFPSARDEAALDGLLA